METLSVNPIKGGTDTYYAKSGRRGHIRIWLSPAFREQFVP
jgi:hypothetical protein